MKIRIMTDSTCDLSPAYLQAHDVTVIPLTVNLDGKSYADDGVAITPDAIFEAVAGGSELPKTSAINVEDYHRTFTRALKTCDAIIHFAISAEFSSCHANAVAAAKGLPVYCVDSRSLSSGIGLLVAEAVDMAEAGCEDPRAIVEHCTEMIDKVDCSFIINRLDYLYKGGRCSMVAMLGANMLHLKPCIEVVDGGMIVGRKFRGSYDRCVKQYVEDRLHDPDALNGKRVCITHTGLSEKQIAAIRALVEARRHFDEIWEVRAGSTISCHCGENTFGLIGLKK